MPLRGARDKKMERGETPPCKREKYVNQVVHGFTFTAVRKRPDDDENPTSRLLKMNQSSERVRERWKLLKEIDVASGRQGHENVAIHNPSSKRSNAKMDASTQRRKKWRMAKNVHNALA